MRTRNGLKRSAILEAGGKVFPRKGFHKTLMDDVAREAGIGKGTIYRYFSSKEELFFNILDQGMDEIYNKMLEIEQRKDDPEIRIWQIMEGTVDFVIKNGPLLNLLHEIEGKIIMKRVPKVKAHNKRMLEITAKVLREGAKAGKFRPGNYRLWARMILTASRGAVFDSRGTEKEKALEEMRSMLFYGISKNQET